MESPRRVQKNQPSQDADYELLSHMNNRRKHVKIVSPIYQCLETDIQKDFKGRLQSVSNFDE